MKLVKIGLLPILYVVFILHSDIYPGLSLSHHDFSGASWSNGEMCLPCHTPHNANMEVPNSTLWNHQVTSATYQIYASPTLNAFPGQPTGKSKLCLSCHDGTVAVDNHSGNTTGTRFIGPGSMGVNLGVHHPISFTYNSALAASDGELNDPSVTMSGLGGTIQQDLLENNVMQCTSCHDVHISRNTQGCIGCHDMHGNIYLQTLSLWKSNDGSGLCLTCHVK